MRQTRPKSKLPVIVTLTLTGLVMVLGNAHLCHLHSTIIEIALLVSVPFACCCWTARAGTPGKAWVRTGSSLVVAVALQSVYLTWLHSESFPEAFLSRKARERQAQTDETRARITQQRAGADAEDREAQP